MAVNNLLDIAKANGSDAVVGLIDETIKAHPELQHVASRTIKGINYKTLVRTALGATTGSFRAANSGTTPVKSTYENRLIECYILEARWQADKAVADAYEDGAQAYIALEAAAIMEGEMQGLASQFYYGSANNALGYPGLMNMYDSTNMVVDAGGTTDSVASSCWLVRVGPQDTTWVWGNNGELKLPQPRLETATDPADSTKKFDAYVQSLYARPGLQVGSLKSICRIKKLTTDSGKGLTDKLIADALGKFPVGKGPTAIFCSRRSLAQLQSSRTVTIDARGSNGRISAVADTPTEAFGIPIYPTEAIKDTELLAS